MHSSHAASRREFCKGFIKNAAKEFPWQWVFPAKQLTYDSKRGEYRHSHLHETQVQRAIRRAVSAGHLSKRASAHTFCHSVASHLLQGHYDIRTIRELLGYSDVRTIMIYTHTVKSIAIIISPVTKYINLLSQDSANTGFT